MNNIKNNLDLLYWHFIDKNNKISSRIKKISQDSSISTGVLPGEESTDSEDVPSNFTTAITPVAEPAWLTQAKISTPQFFRVNQFGHTAFMDTNGVGYFFGDLYWIPGDVTDVRSNLWQADGPMSSWSENGRWNRGWSTTNYQLGPAAEAAAKRIVEYNNFYFVRKGGRPILRNFLEITFRPGNHNGARTWPERWEKRWNEPPPQASESRPTNQNPQLSQLPKGLDEQVIYQLMTEYRNSMLSEENIKHWMEKLKICDREAVENYLEASIAYVEGSIEVLKRMAIENPSIDVTSEDVIMECSKIAQREFGTLDNLTNAYKDLATSEYAGCGIGQISSYRGQQPNQATRPVETEDEEVNEEYEDDEEAEGEESEDEYEGDTGY